MCIGLSMTYSHAQTERFITIIGPDGFPMVVPYIDKSKPEQPAKNQRVTPVQNDDKPSIPQDTVTVPSIHFSSPQKAVQPNSPSIDLLPPVRPVENVKSQENTVEKLKIAVAETQVAVPVVIENSIKVEPSHLNEKVVIASSENSNSVTANPVEQNIAPKQQDQKQAQQEGLLVQPNTSVSNRQADVTHQQKTDAGYVLVDGEKYYDAEYLEENEFNLEGKSRFYQIPMAGSGGSNWNIIERAKGVDMSWFNWRNKAQESARQEVVVLGEHYQVLSAELIKDLLPTQCFNTKILKKAKELKNQTASFWPRAPLKEDFDFEILSLNQQKVQNLKITSFAKSEKNQAYYWPLVVFLDQKGCVTEGVSSYFTQTYDATMLQRESIEGVIQLPENAYYVLFTPLESSIDLPEKKLTNEGQIILTVLR